MRKDISIPVVKNVFMAAVPEWSDDFMDKIWNIYLVNDGDSTIDNVMVVSKAFGTVDNEMKKTSTLRHAFVEVAGISFVKVEMVVPDVMALNNEFMVTYFQDQKLYDKKFIFKANLNQQALEEVPLLFKDGVIVD